jgi:Zn-dependent M28 family amino/carboxypeptidase
MIRRRLLFVLPGLVLMVALAAPRASTQGAPPISQVFDAAALLKDLQILSADDMQGREIGTAGGEKARSYIVERFRAVGLLPVGNGYSWPFAFAGGRAGNQTRSGVNVVGRLPGTKPDGRYIVITAHYDHIGIRNGVVFNGADDNGSGTAALFTVAAYFKAHPTEHPLLFVAFDGEESGLRGAAAFVREPPVPAASLALNLNMDMIGREPGDKLFVVGTRTQPALLPVIQRVAATAPVKLLAGHDDPGEKEDWTKDSDHYAFMQAKIPALYFGVEDFDQHHKATDDFATITAGFYVRAVETMIAVVREFDASLDTLR